MTFWFYSMAVEELVCSPSGSRLRGRRVVVDSWNLVTRQAGEVRAYTAAIRVLRSAVGA